MTDSKVSALAAQTGATLATGDLFEVVDVSDTSMDASGTNEKITADELAIGLATTLGLVGRDKIFDAKGDLPVGTGADAASKLAVGSDVAVLTADSSQTTGLKWKLPTRSVADTHTDTTVVSTTAETPLASLAIPTTVAAGDVVHAYLAGDALNNSGVAVTYTFKVIVGATTVLTSNALSIATSANRQTWRIDIDLLVVGPTNDQRVSLDSMINGATAGWLLGTGTRSGSGRGTAAEDLTAGKNLQVSITLNRNDALSDCVCHEAVLEVAKR